MTDYRKKFDFAEIKEFIEKQSQETRVYVGSDSERFQIGNDWFADYITVIVVHIDGCHGCKVFGQVDRERVYDQRQDRPAMRLMNEVYRTAQTYLTLTEEVDLGSRQVDIHLDINPDEQFGSSCVVQQAVGYIRGVCNVVPFVKPDAWAASFGADRFRYLHYTKAAS